MFWKEYIRETGENLRFTHDGQTNTTSALLIKIYTRILKQSIKMKI